MNQDEYVNYITKIPPAVALFRVTAITDKLKGVVAVGDEVYHHNGKLHVRRTRVPISIPPEQLMFIEYTLLRDHPKAFTKEEWEKTTFAQADREEAAKKVKDMLRNGVGRPF